ncbi:MAG: NADH-ubiquinone oxidoreductase-F iron-sulfur binding region domain-containing protein, partial [Fervidobacterium sp.]
KYLEEIALISADASFCGLGQSINVPLLSLINNFREEFIEHIDQRICKANLCKEIKKKANVK